jgi:GNAT superfamily N-acetyltransferase
MIVLRPARPDEAASLTKLCLRSKAVWGYDRDFMAACRAELTLTPEAISASCVEVAETDDGRILGLAQLSIHGTVAELDKLFVDPGNLRSGAGSALFTWATAEASRRGASLLMIDADPDAAAFYRRMGAADAGSVPSGSIPGRVIPRLRVELPFDTARG